MPSNHLILSHPFSCLQSFPESGSFLMSWLFTSGGQSIGASASASVLPVNIQRLISFRICWFDLLAVQWTLKSLQHQSSKLSFLKHSAFFMVQIPHPYMTTGKTIVLTRLTFVGKVVSLLFNILSRLVIASLQDSCYSLPWLYSESSLTYKSGNPPGTENHCYPEILGCAQFSESSSPSWRVPIDLE